MTVNKKLVSEWINRLRYGNLKQTKGSLHKDDGYCCLGVLGEVLGCDWIQIAATNLVNTTVYGIEYKSQFGRTEIDSALIPLELWEETGFPRSFRVILSSLNDAGVPFDVIAATIEERMNNA